MNLRQLVLCLQYLCTQMIKSEAKLTALDKLTGDGDHGIGIKRGFSALHKLLQDPAFTPVDTGDCLKQAGTRLMTSMGGASGAIFGTLFRCAGTALQGESEFNAKTLAHWLNQGIKAVHQRGGANTGDKTMMDALVPAAESARNNESATLNQALSACAIAAMQGAENTKTMQAKFGRAKNLGERAIGHCDPGAISMALILQFMYDYVATTSASCIIKA